MSAREYEGTLNVWLAGHLRKRGLSAREERAQGGGRRIDVDIRIGPVKIALEAEQGQTPNKKAEAIRDADKRLRQRLADCAIALCYAEGVTESELPDSECSGPFAHRQQIARLRMLTGKKRILTN